MIEIEVKAHIDANESERVRHLLLQLCDGVCQTVDKRDTYFHLPNDNAPQCRSVRIRRTADDMCRCTVKARHTAGGVECNREQEFEVDTYDGVCAALTLFGFAVDICKHKTGHAYHYNGLLIEVVNVDGLGGFVEIERLMPEDKVSSERKREVTALLLRMLTHLKVPHSAIEERRYIDLLRGGEHA